MSERKVLDVTEEKLGLPEWAEWVARDKNGKLNVFSLKPYLNTKYGYAQGLMGSRSKEIEIYLFPQVRWGDEPTKVLDLLKGTTEKGAESSYLSGTDDTGFYSQKMKRWKWK